MNKYDLQERLIKFSVSMVELSKDISKTKSGVILGSQLIRSGTSVSLNYGEAQSAESRKDFIHKMKIILKELRETHICLKIITKTSDSNFGARIENHISESNELISIFVKSIETAMKNKEKSQIIKG